MRWVKVLFMALMIWELHKGFYIGALLSALMVIDTQLCLIEKSIKKKD
jgi:hypothetical protein